MDPPQIPASMLKGVPQQEPPKSNFLFILMMTFLVIWTLQLFRAKDDEPIVPVEEQNPVASTAPVELTEADRAALPKEFVEKAEEAQTNEKPGFVTLGSLDPQSPYRMLVTLTNRGAALSRVELNEAAYIDNSDSTGYLGQIIVDESLANQETLAGLPGVAAQVVGVGTPAATAGLKPGDRIVSFSDPSGKETKINEVADLRNALLQTKPGDKISLGIYEAERLAENENFKLLQLTTSKYFVKIASKPSLPYGVAEEVETPNANTETGETSGADAGMEKMLADSADAEPSKDAADDAGTSQTADTAPLASELGEPKTLQVELIRAPLSVLRPSGMVRDYEDYLDLVGLQGGYVDFGENEESYLRNYDKKAPHVRKVNSEPTSFLTTLGNIDGDKLVDWAPAEVGGKKALNLSAPRSPSLDRELAGVGLRNGFWDFVPEESSESVAVFKKTLLERRLEVVKKYELVKVSDGSGSAQNANVFGNGRAYHLKLTFQVRNFDPNNSRGLMPQ